MPQAEGSASGYSTHDVAIMQLPRRGKQPTRASLFPGSSEHLAGTRPLKVLLVLSCLCVLWFVQPDLQYLCASIGRRRLLLGYEGALAGL